MRATRIGLLVVGATATLAGVAGGTVVVGAAARPSGHAAAKYHVTVVLAGQAVHDGVVLGDFGVSARFATNKPCRPVTAKEQECELRNLDPDGDHFGHLQVHEHGGIRFLVTSAHILWNPVNRRAAVNIFGTVTTSHATAFCKAGDRVLVEADTRGRGRMTFSCGPRFEANMNRSAVALTGDALSSQWTITGTWRTLQSNKYAAAWHFEQTKTTVTGTVTIPKSEQAAQRFTSNVTQVFDGSLIGNKLKLKIQWNRTDGEVIRGQYEATLEPGAKRGLGRIVGRTWDLANPPPRGGVASWTGTGFATCLGACR